MPSVARISAFLLALLAPLASEGYHISAVSLHGPPSSLANPEPYPNARGYDVAYNNYLTEIDTTFAFAFDYVMNNTDWFDGLNMTYSIARGYGDGSNFNQMTAFNLFANEIQVRLSCIRHKTSQRNRRPASAPTHSHTHTHVCAAI